MDTSVIAGAVPPAGAVAAVETEELTIRKLPLVQSWAASDLAGARSDPLTLFGTDNLLKPESQTAIYAFLTQPGWQFGWKSNPQRDTFSFWHKHFAGTIHPDHVPKDGKEKAYDCAAELERNAPLLHAMWRQLEASILKDHVLVRCYANAHAYGGDGTLHTDSISTKSHTVIYYPHKRWAPDWGGETVFFNQEKSDVAATVYPKPNRLVAFRGTVPHVARGVARSCPMLRITLMFKTET
jgi:SM-20-related protein